MNSDTGRTGGRRGALLHGLRRGVRRRVNLISAPLVVLNSREETGGDALPIHDESRRMPSSPGTRWGRFIERCRTVENLPSNETTLRILLRELPLAVWTVDPELNLRTCAGRIHGSGGLRTPLPDAGISIESWFPPGHAALDAHRGALAGRSARFDLDREDRAFACAVEPLRDDEGAIVGAMAAAMDVTEFRRAQESDRRRKAELEREVERRNREAREALRELNSISYTIAHDLRAPLRSIASGAQIILEERDKLGDEARQWAARIVEAANRMDSLVLGLLEYSRLARQEFTCQVVDLEAVLEDAVSRPVDQLLRPRPELTIERPLAPVKGDPGALAQTLRHLLSNAAKFVGPGVSPKIRVRTERRSSPDAVRLWVEDNGIGIAPEHRERIFDIFERLHRREEIPGTGLGLAVARRLIDRMGGTIGVESEPGRGSRFFIDMPGAEAA